MAALIAVVLAPFLALQVLAAAPEELQPPQALVVAATDGDSEAQFALGLWYCRTAPASTNRFGAGFQAAKWLRRAADDRNHDKAQFYLALAYLDGVGVEQDSEKALYWFRRAAGQSLPEAKFNVALLQEQAGGPPAGEDDSAQLLRRAADLGLAEAHFTMAVLTAEGRVFRQSDTEAWECYRNARTNQFAQPQIDAAIKLEKTVRESGHATPVGGNRPAGELADPTKPLSAFPLLRHLSKQGTPDNATAATNWWSNALPVSFASRRFAMLLRLPENLASGSTDSQGEPEKPFPVTVPIAHEEPEQIDLLGTTNVDEVMSRFRSLAALDRFLRLKGYEPRPAAQENSPRYQRGESRLESLLDRQHRSPFEGVPPAERVFIEEVRGRMAARDEAITQVNQEIARFAEAPDSFIRQLPSDPGLFEQEFRLKFGTTPLDWYLDHARSSIKLEEILNVVSRMYTRGGADAVEGIQLVRLLTRRYGALDTGSASLTVNELEKEIAGYRRQVARFLSGEMGPKVTHEARFGERSGGSSVITVIDEFDNSRPPRRRRGEDVAEISALYNAIAKHQGWPLLAPGQIELQSVAEASTIGNRGADSGAPAQK